MTLREYRGYASYKDSGVEWLGEIPTHWEAKRLKDCVSRLESGGTPESDNLRYWSDDETGTPWVAISDMTRGFHVRDTAKRLTPEGLHSKRLPVLPAGTLLYSMYASLGKVALLEIDAVVNQAILGLVTQDELASRGYLRWWFAFMEGHVQLLASSNTQDNLNAEKVRRMPVFLPGPDEQRAVAAFLDREAARIDAMVAKKERLIELLQEKRTALITRAVTKGLDPGAPRKESGVEWLGEISAHWKVLPLRRLTISRCDGPFGSGLKSEHYTTMGVRVIRLQNVGWADFIDADRAYVDENHARKLGDHSVVGGDLLIAGLGDEGHPAGRACEAPVDIEPAMVKADCFRFRLDTRMTVPRFVAYQLSVTASTSSGSLATGATRERINLTATAGRQVALPPLSEQRLVVDALDSLCAEHVALIAKIRVAIDRLKELRTAFVSAAVTGAIDVRDAAPVSAA